MDDHLHYLGDYRQSLQTASTEHLAIVHLGYDRRIIARRFSACGTIDRTQFPIRMIIADALNLGSREIILAHNHPSGRVEPSAADLAETRKLAALLAQLDVELVEHIIICKGETFSMRKHGLLSGLYSRQETIFSGAVRFPEASNAAR